MQLVYDRRDLDYAERRGDLRLKWLRDLGAVALQDLRADDEGFLFGYQIPTADFAKQVQRFPGLRDQPDDREQLTRLDDILVRLQSANIDLPTPRTWVLGIDDPLPADLSFPLFVRTSTSSWKRGGQISKVRTLKELVDECEMLRRAFQWDATILAREWLKLATAGKWRHGSVPVEIRVWIVDAVPFAWSFHYLGILDQPKGFPPTPADLNLLASYAYQFAAPFTSRLVAADFVRDVSGKWHFLEAGPGACCGTAHQRVFEAVAAKLIGIERELEADAVGGRLPNLSVPTLDDLGAAP